MSVAQGQDISADSAALRALLGRVHTIAVVGLSDNPARPSYGVAAYMQRQGYRIVPVNPTITSVLGEPAYASLLDLPFAVDLVDIFRRAEQVEAVIHEAIQIGAPVVWMQLGIAHAAAAQRAQAAGLDVVMDRCLKIEHARLS